VIVRALTRQLGGTVEVGCDIRQVGGAKLVDHRLHIAPPVQVLANLKAWVAVGETNHGAEVAAAGLSPHGDMRRIDAVLGRVRSQIPDRGLDVRDAVAVDGPIQGSCD
jgi:hypothetical protein